MVRLSYIDRFGAQNVYGRPLGAGEMRRMITAENIVRAYRTREKAANWALWAKENPDDARMLANALKLTEEAGEDD